jgi:diaminohydroxyphosphoribosylaminopyrimidine deaminase / 5-amino-6-(5-phosphoribosylamino)uracil reductase
MYCFVLKHGKLLNCLYRYSLSANGLVTNQIGEGAAESGGYYSKLLQEYDGVILSSNLAETSMFPKSKETGANQPLYILIARDKNSPLILKSLDEDTAANVVVLADKSVPIDAKFEVEMVVMENLTLNSVLDYCLKRGLSGVFVDFREDDDSIRSLLRSFHEGNLVNKVIMEVLPIWSSGEGHSGLNFGSNNLRLKDLESRVINGSVLVEGYLC